MILFCHGPVFSDVKHTIHITNTQTKTGKDVTPRMTANWKTLRTTLVWLLVAVMTLGIVIASPYLVKSDAASPKASSVVIA